MMMRYIVTFITAIVTVFAALGAFYQQIESRRRAEMTAYESEFRRDQLEAQIGQLLKQSVAELPPKATDAAMEVKLGELRGMVEAVDQKTLALRQAINPIKPDEILTIARLTDEIRQVRRDFDELQKSLSAQQAGFQESILRETKSSSDASRWLFVVLIPLLVNFFYTVWKDLRSGRNESSSREEQKAAEVKPSAGNSTRAPQQGAQADSPASDGPAD